MASRIKGIVVEIGGDTTKLETALKSVNKMINETQAELKDVSKLLKLDPGNTELLAQKHSLLAKAIEETKDKLSTLKQAAKSANEALEKGEISKGQYDALKREIAETESKLKELENQAKTSAVALEKIGQAGESISKFGDKVSKTGEKLMPVTAGVAALGTAAVSMTSSFESAMSQVQATVGITSDAVSEVGGETVNTMDALGKLAKEMGSTTAFSASECAAALNYLALAGYDSQKMFDVLPTVLNLAAAGALDLASASDMVTDAMSALGMSANDAEVMVDQMAKTASSSNTSVGQLGEAILTIGATAKTMNGGLSELNTALGILANNGIKGSEAGTHLRNILLALQNPTDKAAVAIKDLGVNVYDSKGEMRLLNDILMDFNSGLDSLSSEEKAQAIATIFNKTDLASINTLLDNAGESFNNLETAISNASGAASQMANTQLDNLSGQITILKSALEGLAISLGELLMPYIKGIVSAIQSFVDWLNSLDESSKKLIITIGLIAGALGPVLIFVGKVVSAIGSIMSFIPKLAAGLATLKTAIAGVMAFLSANPVVLVVAAISALIAGIVTLYNKCEWFRDCINNIVTGILGFFKSAGNFLADLFTNKIPETFSKAKDKLDDFVSGFKEGFTNVKESVNSFVSKSLEDIKTGMSDMATNISTAFVNIKSFFSNLWSSIATSFSSFFNSIVQNPIVEVFVTSLQSLFTNAANTISSVFTNLSMVIENIFTIIKNVMLGAVVLICDFITLDFETLKEDAISIFNNIQESLSNILIGIVNIVSTLLEGMKNRITIIFNGIKQSVSGIISAVKNTVINTVTYLKDRTLSLVQELSDGAASIFMFLKENAIRLFMEIKSGVVNVIASLVNTVTSSFTAFVNSIISLCKEFLTGLLKVFTDIKDGIVSKWEETKTMVSGIFSSIRQKGEYSFSTMLNNIKNALSGLTNIIKEGFKGAISYITSLPSTAVSWGKDLVNGIAKGIRNAISNVKSAVKSVADTIRSYLHFSVPDVGPLTDYESWMPDFMKGLAKGIEESRDLVEKAISKVSSDLVLSPEMGTVINGRYNTDTINSEATITVPLYIDGKKIAEATSKYQSISNRSYKRSLGVL